MKTLSFVKQAMAVALLISAVNVSAMNYLKAIPGGLLSAAQYPARLTGKAFGYLPCWRKSAQKDVVLTPEVKDTAGNVTQPEVRGDKSAETLFVADVVYKKYESSAIGQKLAEYPKVQAGLLAFTGVTIAAAVTYGLYKAYQAAFGKSEATDVVEDQVQEEAQPEVEVAAQEQTEEVVPAQPVKKIGRVNPIA